MSRLVRLFFLIFVVSVLPSLAYSQSIDSAFSALGSGDGGKDYPSFTPPPTDLSVNYLSSIFGTVGTVLHGTSGQMLGQLFKVFNIGILVIAGITLIYTIFMTILNTAQEGEFMSRKWNSAWIAIRTVLGLGLLVPSATTGYSTVQVLVMWVVIQGVGFANMAWFSALGYLAKGQIYTPPSTDISSMINLSGTIFEMQTCMYTAQNVAQTNQKNVQQGNQESASTTGTTNTAIPNLGNNQVLSFTPLFTDITNAGKTYSVVMFPGNPYPSDGKQDNACGQLNFGESKTNKTNTIQAAVRQMVMDTDSFANQIVNPLKNEGNQNFPSQAQAAIVGAAADFINITLPIRAGGPSLITQLMATFASNAVAQGWILAGQYYYALGTVQQQLSSTTSVTVGVDALPAGFNQSSTSGDYISFTSNPKIDPNQTNGNNTPFKTTGQTQPGLIFFTTNDKQTLVSNETTAANFVVSANGTAKQVDAQNSKWNITLDTGGSGILGFLLTPVTTVLFQVIGDFSNAVGNPIIVLQDIGNIFMVLSAAMWLAGTVGIFGLGTVSSILSSANPVGFGVEDAVLAFVPTFTAFILIFFVLGATFAYYVPLIPFIIFVFSAVGWLIAVIEAMIAAPIVALGITHPEGHDLLGKSEQAVMLLLSVFLRPVLMIIGLIAGMILSQVVVRYLNLGFFGIVFDVGDFNLFAFVAMLVVYCMLLVTVVNQSFSLIYMVPDRVMRWIGVTEQTPGVQEALQSSRQGFDQITSGTQELGKGIQSSGASWKGKQLERKRDWEDKNRGGPGATPTS